MYVEGGITTSISRQPVIAQFERPHLKSIARTITWSEQGYGSRSPEIFHITKSGWKSFIAGIHLPATYLIRLEFWLSVSGLSYLNWIDSHSKWPKVIRLMIKSSAMQISCLQGTFLLNSFTRFLPDSQYHPHLPPQPQIALNVYIPPGSKTQEFYLCIPTMPANQKVITGTLWR